MVMILSILHFCTFCTAQKIILLVASALYKNNNKVIKFKYIGQF